MLRSSFRSHLEAGEWASIEWRELAQKEQDELLQRLKKVVPLVSIENGMERTSRYATPKEVGSDENLMAAAMTLYEGELKAQVEGVPPKASKAWRETLDQIQGHIEEMSNEGEVTKGNSELGRLSHIVEAQELLNGIEFETYVLRDQCKDDEEKEWLVEALSSIANLSFNAGRHFQAAWTKSFEDDAVRGEKVAGGSKNAAHQTNATHIELREWRLKRLKELGFPSCEGNSPKMKLADAIRICKKEGLGSETAISRTYHRWKKL